MNKRLKYFLIFIMWVVALITFFWCVCGLPTLKICLAFFSVYVMFDIERMKSDEG